VAVDFVVGFLARTRSKLRVFFMRHECLSFAETLFENSF